MTNQLIQNNLIQISFNTHMALVHQFQVGALRYHFSVIRQVLAARFVVCSTKSSLNESMSEDSSSDGGAFRLLGRFLRFLCL